MQICDGLLVMHSSDPRFAHNDIKPGNVLLERRNGNMKAVIMDYGSVSPARRKVSTRKEALALQVRIQKIFLKNIGALHLVPSESKRRGRLRWF